MKYANIFPTKSRPKNNMRKLGQSRYFLRRFLDMKGEAPKGRREDESILVTLISWRDPYYSRSRGEDYLESVLT